MAELMIIGALALDRPIRLSGAVAPGARLSGRSLGGAMAARLGGGGANAGVALTLAGHKVRVAAVVADDGDGASAVEMSRAAGLDVSLVARRPGPSRTTLILIDPDGERAVINLGEPPPTPWPLTEPVANSARPQGLFVRAGYPGAAAWAERCDGPVIAHWPSGYDGPADVVVCSADDLDTAWRAAPYAAARRRFGVRLTAVVVTHGANGAVAHRQAGDTATPAPVATVRDTTGAGDVFAAGLLDALVAGASLQEAVPHACRWGAATIELDSSAPVDAPPGTFRAF